MKKITELSIIDIAKYVQWKEVKRSIKYHYPTDKNDYEDLFYRLQKMKKVRVPMGEYLIIEGGIDIDSEWFRGEYGQQKYLDSLKSCEDEQFYSVGIKKVGEKFAFAMSFLKWSYLSSLPIHHETLRNFCFVDIVAHFIWEITFYGNEKESLAEGRKLRGMVKEIKKNNT